MRRLPQLPPHLERHREVERHLADERLSGARDDQLGPDLVFEMHVRSDAVADELGVESLACSRGCAWCCYGGNVDASVPEALDIVQDLRARLAPPEWATVLTRIRNDAADARERGVDARLESMVPCPLLDRERGACLAYDHRPSTCRAHVSYDAKACEAARASTEVTIPADPEFKAVHTIGGLSVNAACTRAGLDARMFPLSAALEAAAEPDAAARWAAGERLLDCAEVTGKAAAPPNAAAAQMLRDLGFPELVSVHTKSRSR